MFGVVGEMWFLAVQTGRGTARRRARSTGATGRRRRRRRRRRQRAAARTPAMMITGTIASKTTGFGSCLDALSGPIGTRKRKVVGRRSRAFHSTIYIATCRCRIRRGRSTGGRCGHDVPLFLETPEQFLGSLSVHVFLGSCHDE